MIQTNQQLMDHITNFVKTTFTSTGQILPMWIIVDEKGSHSVVMTPFSGDKEKDMTAEFIKMTIKKTRALRIGFMSETWVAQGRKGMTKEEARTIIPSEQPDRKEAILIMVEDIYGKSLNGMIEILRDKNGKGKLGSYHSTPFTETEGRFSHLFDKETAH